MTLRFMVQAAADPFATGAPEAVNSAANAAAAALDPFEPIAAPEHAVGLTPQGWAIGIGVIVAAAVVWFFVRGAIQTMLAKNHVAPDAASGAAWSLFAFLLCLTAFVVFGVIGNLWLTTAFLVPTLGLTIALLVLTVVMLLSALGKRR